MPARSRSQSRFAVWFAAPDQAWFVWPPPPAPPKPPKRAPKPKPKPVRAPSLPAKPQAKSQCQTLPPDVREILDDRLEAAHVDGRINLIDEGEDVSASVEITLGEYNLIRQIVLREEFEPRRPPARPTNCPPGSAGKVAELARRAEAGEELTHKLDADPLADDRLGVEVFGRGKANPTVEVADEMIDDVPVSRGHGLDGRGGGTPRDKRPHRHLRDD